MLITVTFIGCNQSFQIFLYLLVLCLCNVFWKGSTILSISSFYQDPCYFLYSSFLYELTMELLTYPIFQAPSKAKRSHLSPFPIFCCFPSFTPRKCHFSQVADFISFPVETRYKCEEEVMTVRNRFHYQIKVCWAWWS